MATEKEIMTLVDKMKDLPPSNVLSSFSDNSFGFRAILQYLLDEERSVSAKMIAEKMNISCARVAVLLSRMESKGLVEKKTDDSDMRKLSVSLTEEGISVATKNRSLIYERIEMIIDSVGFERMNEFTNILEDIKKANGMFLNKHPEIKEEIN